MELHSMKPRTVFWFPLIVLALCLMTGMAYEAIATLRLRSRAIRCKLVEVGGYRLYINCQGNGLPTVVIDSGLGDDSDVRSELHSKFAELARTCVYDRAGLGRSDNGPLPRSSEQIVKELHTLLTNAEETGPFLFVAHSMAGYDARIFAHRFPRELAGLLLLDVSHPDQNDRESATASKDRNEFMLRQAWYGRLPPFGITRLLGHCEFHPQDCSRSFRTTFEEYDAFTNISPAQVRAAGDLGDLPLIVIAHDPAAEIAIDASAQVRQDEAIDLQMQRELSELSTRGCLLIAVGSRHYVQDARPDMVLKSLESLIQSARSGIPAAGLCDGIH
jgi:pimeloyl-ACP methyl ester carboxylesterase